MSLKMFVVLLCTGEMMATLPSLPVRTFHGYYTSCETLMQRDPHQCIETGEGIRSILDPMAVQAKRGCDLLVEQIEELNNGFYIIAYSQGGLLARHILINCKPIRRLIKRMIFVGTPQLGYDPEGEQFQSIEELNRKGRKLLAWEDYATYKGLTAKFLRDLSSVKSSSYYNQLDLFGGFVSRIEGTVRPSKSTSFGANLIGQNELELLDISPEFAKIPAIKKLYDDGRLFSCLSQGKHNRFTEEERDIVFKYLITEHPDAEDYRTSARMQMKIFLTEFPNFCDSKVNL